MNIKIDQILNKEEELYVYDDAYQENLLKEHPWTKE